MKLLTAEQMAERLNKSIYTIYNWLKADKLPGRKLGGTWVSTAREIYDFERGVDLDEIRMEKLYDLKDVARTLDIPVYVARHMIDDGILKGTPIDERGSGTRTLVFTEKEVEEAKGLVEQYRPGTPGRSVKGEPDQYIYRLEDDRYHIKGTMDREGNMKSYAFLAQARDRARKAFEENEPRYEAGQEVMVQQEDRVRGATILRNTTVICETALVELMDDGAQMVVDVDDIRTLEEAYAEMQAA